MKKFLDGHVQSHAVLLSKLSYNKSDEGAAKS